MNDDETTQTETTPPPSTMFKTKEIDQGAFVWIQPGTKIVKMEPDSRSPNVFWFVFQMQVTEVELNQLLFAYANGETMVEPAAFCVKQGKLRDMIHMGKGRRR